MPQTGSLSCARQCAERLPDLAKRVALGEWNAATARKLADKMPPGVGFVLVTFNFGVEGSRAYASNGRREDTINMLRELLAKIETEGT